MRDAFGFALCGVFCQGKNRQRIAETYASAANSLERFLHGHDLPLSLITSSLM